MNSRLWLVLLLTSLMAGGFGYARGFSVAESRVQTTLAQERESRALERAMRSDEDRARAEAVAEAERAARTRLQAASARTTALAAELVTARQQITDARQSFNRRLSHVAENVDAACSGLPPEWVGLYNEATRSWLSRPNTSRSRARPGSAGATAPGVVEGTNATRTADAGVRGGVSLAFFGKELAEGGTFLEKRLHPQDCQCGAHPSQKDFSPRATGSLRTENVAQQRAVPELTTPKDILAHIRDYGGYCRSLEVQLNSLVPLVTTP